MADVRASLIILVFITLKCSISDAQYPLVLSVINSQAGTRLQIQVNDDQLEKLKNRTCESSSFFFLETLNRGVTTDSQCQSGSKQGDTTTGNFQTVFVCLYNNRYEDIDCNKTDVHTPFPDCTPGLSVSCDSENVLVTFDSRQDPKILDLKDDETTLLESCCRDPQGTTDKSTITASSSTTIHPQTTTSPTNTESPATSSSLSPIIPNQQKKTSDDDSQITINKYHIGIIVGTAIASMLLTILVVCCVFKLRNIRRDKAARKSTTNNGREEHVIGNRFVNISMSSLQNANAESHALPNQRAVAQVSPIQAASGLSSSGLHYFDIDIGNSDFIHMMINTDAEVNDTGTDDAFDDDNYIYPDDIDYNTDSNTYSKLGQSRKESDNTYNILPEESNEASTSQRQGEDEISPRKTPNYILQTSTGHYVEIDLPLSPSTADLVKSNPFEKGDISSNPQESPVENNTTQSIEAPAAADDDDEDEGDSQIHSQVEESNRVFDNSHSLLPNKDTNTQVSIPHKNSLPEVIPVATSRLVVADTENASRNSSLNAIPSFSSIASASQRSNESAATNVSGSTEDGHHIHFEGFDTHDQSLSSKSRDPDTPLEVLYNILSTKKDEIMNEPLPVEESNEQSQNTHRSLTPMSSTRSDTSLDDFNKSKGHSQSTDRSTTPLSSAKSDNSLDKFTKSKEQLQSNDRSPKPTSRTRSDKSLDDLNKSKEQTQSKDVSSTPRSSTTSDKSLDESNKILHTHTPNVEALTDASRTSKMIPTKTRRDSAQTHASVTPEMDKAVSVINVEKSSPVKPIKVPRKTIGTSSAVSLDSNVQTKTDYPVQTNVHGYKNITKHDSGEHKDTILTTPYDIPPARNDVAITLEGCEALDTARKQEPANVYDQIVGPPRKISTTSSGSVAQIQVDSEKSELDSVNNDYEDISCYGSEVDTGATESHPYSDI